MGYEWPKMSEQRAVAVPMRATSKPKVERDSPMILYIRSNGNMLVSCLVQPDVSTSLNARCVTSERGSAWSQEIYLLPLFVLPHAGATIL